MSVVVPTTASRTFRAMAVDVSLQLCSAGQRAEQALDRAEAVFRRVEAACTRFVPHSPLMQANADPDSWHVVPAVLLDVLEEAARAHRDTAGLFDPRVLRSLTAWGYDRSLPFADGSVRLAPAPTPAVAPRPFGTPWRPRFDRVAGRVHLGGAPVDLGGIGKGLAVRWASAELAAVADSLVDAGGDCQVTGRGPQDTGWRIGVEDPGGEAQPVAVLQLVDTACTTSSVRVRRWHVGTQEVHHLVDPRTGRPGGAGLQAVTVVGADPAHSEVWGKVLFLQGCDAIADTARHAGLAALWVTEDGAVHTSPALAPYLIWMVQHAEA